MYSTNEFRKGLKVEIDGEPFIMIDNQFVKPGKGQAFNRVRLKSLVSGRVLDRTFKSGERIDRANIEEHKMQYLYNDAAGYHFMNTSSYEQVTLTKEHVEDSWKWLIENLEVSVLFHNGRAISVEVPFFVELEITYCEPGLKGDTATGASKPATLSSGAVVQVPLFVNQGDVIRVDTRTGEYLDRAARR